MKQISVAVAVTAIVAVGAAAYAHNGATGVVRERMEGMVAMRNVLRDLTPMMQGSAGFDAALVAQGGRTIASHAGQTLVALFPEGTGGGASYATDAVWSEANTFRALADELRRHAEGLAAAAPNGLEAPANPREGMDMSSGDDAAGMDMGDTGMAGMDMGDAAMAGMDMGAPAPTGPGQAFTLAQLMGLEPDGSAPTTMVMPRNADPAAPEAAAQAAPALDYASMAADDVFRLIGQSCSSCHARFRKGR